MSHVAVLDFFCLLAGWHEQAAARPKKLRPSSQCPPQPPSRRRQKSRRFGLRYIICPTSKATSRRFWISITRSLSSYTSSRAAGRARSAAALQHSTHVDYRFCGKRKCRIDDPISNHGSRRRLDAGAVAPGSGDCFASLRNIKDRASILSNSTATARDT